MKSLQTCHRAVSPSITPYCFLLILHSSCATFYPQFKQWNSVINCFYCHWSDLQFNCNLTKNKDLKKQCFLKIPFVLLFVVSRQITNGLWPTTWSNLLGAVVIIAALLYAADFYKLSSLQRVTGLLWKVTYLLNLDEAYPYNFRLVVVSVLAGVVFFVTVLYLRQYTLRMLLAYRQWMCKLSSICSVLNTSLVKAPNLKF